MWEVRHSRGRSCDTEAAVGTFTVPRKRRRRAFSFCSSSVACLFYVFSRIYPDCWRWRRRPWCPRPCDRGTAARCTEAALARIADRDNPPATVNRRSICRDRKSSSIDRADCCCRRYRSIVSTCRSPRIGLDSRYRDVPRRSVNLRQFYRRLSLSFESDIL